MSIGTAIIGLAMLIFAGLLVTQPLRRKSHTHQPLTTPAVGGGHYDETLLALRDLEFDHQLGVVHGDDYARLRAQLMSQAAQALKRKEQTQKKANEAIETAVRTRRKQRKEAATCPTCRRTLDTHDKFCPTCGTAVKAVCPNCRHLVAADDQYCSTCGTSLAGGNRQIHIGKQR